MPPTTLIRISEKYLRIMRTDCKKLYLDNHPDKEKASDNDLLCACIIFYRDAIAFPPELWRTNDKKPQL
jgi:hypothetical protein